MANDLYRGYEIVALPTGKFEWTDERGAVHNGMVDMRGGFETSEAAMDDIDAYRRRAREAQS